MLGMGCIVHAAHIAPCAPRKERHWSLIWAMIFGVDPQASTRPLLAERTDVVVFYKANHTFWLAEGLDPRYLSKEEACIPSICSHGHPLSRLL